MTEFETCLLMTLKDIKSQLSDIATGSHAIAKQLKEMNEYTGEQVDWSYDIHRDLEKMSDSLARIYQIQDERL